MSGPPDASLPGASTDSAGEDQPEAFLDLLGWPPPGLARVQGDLWRVVRKVYLGGVVLVLPALYAISTPQSEVGLGPVGGAWWVMSLATFLGVALLLDGVVSAVRMLRRSAAALREGFEARVVRLVLADRERDSGFLLQGAQEYSMLSPEERQAVVALRSWAPWVSVGAASWLVFSFGALALLGARGMATPDTLAVGVLAPTVLLQFVALVVLGLAGSVRRRARKAWFAQPWARNLMRSDAAAWREAAASRGAIREGAGSGRFPAGLLTVAVVVGAAVAIIPPVTLTPVSSIGAILGAISGSFATRSEQRAARAEAFRPFRVEADPTLSSAEAGDLLNTLMHVGRAGELAAGMRPPATPYAEKWASEPPNPDWRLDLPPFWTDSIWAHAREGLTAEERDFLERVASHPAHADFSRLARAASVDVIGGRYALPFDSAWTFWTLPFPRFTALREGANAHLGVAVLQSLEGRHAEAEQTVREVVSVGLLLMDDAPSLIENAIGSVIATAGGAALGRVLEASGGSVRAQGLRAAMDGADRAVASMSRAQRAQLGVEGFFEHQMATVADSTALRALRWEFLGSVVGLTPCLNLRRMVFGPGEEFAAWLEGVRSSLVRYPAEQAYFELHLRGPAPLSRPGFVSRLLSISMGGRGEPGSCTQLVDALPSIM